MSGKIKELINEILEKRAKGNDFLVSITKAKMALKGIDADKYTEESKDDPLILDKLRTIAKEMNLNISSV